MLADIPQGTGYTFFDPPCEYPGVSNINGSIGPFSLSDLSAQMTSLLPAAGSLLSSLCAANSTCTAVLAQRKAPGETGAAAIGQWLDAQVTLWQTTIAAAPGYSADMSWCPGAKALCSRNSPVALPYSCLAETLLLELVLWNATDSLFDVQSYSLSDNPSLVSVYTPAVGRRLTADPRLPDSPTVIVERNLEQRRLQQAEAVVGTRKGLDVQWARHMRELSSQSAAATAAASSAQDCSMTIQQNADALASEHAKCAAAVPAFTAFGAAVDAAYGNGTSACKPSLVGLSLIYDMLALCQPGGLCEPVQAADVQASLSGFCAWIDGGSPAYLQRLATGCELLGDAQGLVDSAAACCGDDCSSDGCSYASSGVLLEGFPSAVFNGTGTC